MVRSVHQHYMTSLDQNRKIVFQLPAVRTLSRAVSCVRSYVWVCCQIKPLIPKPSRGLVGFIQTCFSTISIFIILGVIKFGSLLPFWLGGVSTTRLGLWRCCVFSWFVFWLPSGCAHQSKPFYITAFVFRWVWRLPLPNSQKLFGLKMSAVTRSLASLCKRTNLQPKFYSKTPNLTRFRKVVKVGNLGSFLASSPALTPKTPKNPKKPPVLHTQYTHYTHYTCNRCILIGQGDYRYFYIYML